MKDRLLGLLDELGVAYRYVEHPAVFTVAESVEHTKDKRPVKNLALQDDKRKHLFLVVMDGEQKLDMKSLAQKLGVKKLQFAKPELLPEKLGVTPGAVSLFCLLHPGSTGVEVVIDQTLVGEPEVGFHPMENRATVFIPGNTIEKIILSTGHAYKIISIA